jgi:hypothetical protein
MSDEWAREQRSYHWLEQLLDEADKLLDSGVHNERELREAFAKGEDLLDDLDNVEFKLIQEIERAKNDE